MKKQLIDCLKVGDKVFDIIDGWGIVEFIIDSILHPYPITVIFNNDIIDTTRKYTNEGKKYQEDVNPSLFLHEIKLKQELPEFVEGEIVLASSNQDTWHIAKYDKQDTDGNYLVYMLKSGFVFHKDCVVAKYCKSFDKSHFESK